MAIAFGRFGTFKRFIGRSIRNFFVFLKNKIVETVTGRRMQYDEEVLGDLEEKVNDAICWLALVVCWLLCVARCSLCVA